MGLIPALNDYVPDTTIESAEVEGDLSTIRTYFNTYAVLIDVARTITAQHTFSPGSAQAPFVLGANAQDQNVAGLDADSVDGYDAADLLDLANATGTLADARLSTNVPLLDDSNPYTGRYYTPTRTDTNSSAHTVDASNGGSRKIVLANGANTIDIDNLADGQKISIAVYQPASSSAGTVTWSVEMGLTLKWFGGSAPTLTATNGKCDLIGMVRVGSDIVAGFNLNA